MADFGQFWHQNLKLQPEIRQHRFEVFLRFLANYDVSRRMNMGLTQIPDIEGTLTPHRNLLPHFYQKLITGRNRDKIKTKILEKKFSVVLVCIYKTGSI